MLVTFIQKPELSFLYLKYTYLLRKKVYLWELNNFVSLPHEICSEHDFNCPSDQTIVFTYPGDLLRHPPPHPLWLVP